jgi:S1-C subfamily serine protease
VVLLVFLAGGLSAPIAGGAWAARPAPGESPLATWLDGILVPARASVVQVIAYRPSGPVPVSPQRPGLVFRLEPARRTFWATGVVIGGSGLVLACAEAAQPGDSLEIRLPSGAHTGAQFLAQDVDLGLSLLRAEDATGLVPVSLDPGGPVREGEAVVLLGHRAGGDGPDFRFARVAGSWNRPEEPRFYRLALGDCHGSCGDAVLDEHGGFRGVVVGVRAEREEDLAAPPGMPGGDPFECEWVRALSSSAISETAAAMVAASRTPVGFLGVSAAEAGSVVVGAGEPAEPRLPLQITEVLPGSPADAAGIRPGDQIVSLDGHRVSSMEQIAEVVAASPPGKEIRVRVLRDGAPLTLSARLVDHSALDWMERQDRRDAARKKRLEIAIGRLQQEIRDLDAQRRR